MRTSHYLAEETTFRPVADEQLPEQFTTNDTPNWDADPMEILMMKQELERLELEAELSQRH